jgi:hypothetical protein
MLAANTNQNPTPKNLTGNLDKYGAAQIVIVYGI